MVSNDDTAIGRPQGWNEAGFVTPGDKHNYERYNFKLK